MMFQTKFIDSPIFATYFSSWGTDLACIVVTCWFKRSTWVFIRSILGCAWNLNDSKSFVKDSLTTGIVSFVNRFTRQCDSIF